MIGLDYWYITETGIHRREEIGFQQNSEDEAKLMASRQDGNIVKCILIRDYASKNVFGHVVPCKGLDEDNYVVKLVIEDLSWLGHTRIILKSDQERALVALVTQAAMALRFKVDEISSVSVEHSAKYDSQASGGTEVGVRALRGHYRTLKLCLEKSVGRAIPARHAMTSWLLEHAAFLLNVRSRKSDGHTLWAGVRGRPFGVHAISFGEEVFSK